MKKLILVVDDCEDMRACMREALVSEGYEVVEAENGRGALDYLTSDRPAPALIITDLKMPKMSGWDLIDNLLLSRIPIVVASGAELDAHAWRLRGHSARFLRKPFDAGALLAVVEQAIGRAPTGRSNKAIGFVN